MFRVSDPDIPMAERGEFLRTHLQTWAGSHGELQLRSQSPADQTTTFRTHIVQSVVLTRRYPCRSFKVSLLAFSQEVYPLPSVVQPQRSLRSSCFTWSMTARVSKHAAHAHVLNHACWSPVLVVHRLQTHPRPKIRPIWSSILAAPENPGWCRTFGSYEWCACLLSGCRGTLCRNRRHA